MRRTLWKLLLILSLLFVSIGSTVAYLTDSDSEVNVMTLGRVEIDLIEQERNSTGALIDFQDNHPLYPGVHKNGLVVGTDGYWVNVRNAVDKIVTVKNTGKASAYVRLWFAFEVTDDDKFFDSKIHLNRNTTDWTWQFMKDDSGYQYLTLNGSRYVVATATYNKVLTSNATTPISLRQVLLDSSAANDDFVKLGDKYSIFVVAQAMQTEGFDSAVEALTEGFGVPSVANHPFAGMKEEDVDLPTPAPSDKTYGEVQYDDVPVLVEPSANSAFFFTIDKGQRFEIVEFVIENSRVTYMKASFTNPQTGEIVTGYIAWGNAIIVRPEDEEDDQTHVHTWVVLGYEGYSSTTHSRILHCSVCQEVVLVQENHNYDGTGVCICGATQSSDTESTYGDFTYTSDGTSITITGYIGTDTIVVVPSIIDELPVTTIGPKAFTPNPSVTSVDLPDSIKRIEYGAFSGCTGLTSISIPASVVWIGEIVFAECENLTSIHVDNNNISFASRDGILYNSDFSTLLAYPGGKHGSFSIPNDVTNIGNRAFYGCTGLTSIAIPDSVTSIGEGAFSHCSTLSSIVIPNYVTIIQDDTFSRCTSLTSFTIPDSVTVIGDCAFHSCISLSSIAIPNSVTSIGAFTFSDCTGLTSITIPDSVTKIGGFTFSDCSRLTALVYINSYAYTYCIENDVTFELIDSHKDEIPITDFTYTSDGTSITITGYTGTDTDVVIPSTIDGLPVTAIGNGAFRDNKTITSIDIPDGVERLCSSAIWNCSNLTNISIPDTVTTLENHAIGYCSKLTSVDIPNSLTALGAFTFVACKNLTSVTIPASVTSIGIRPFQYCDNLTAIYVDEDNPAYASYEGVLYSKDMTLLIKCPSAKSGPLAIPYGVITIQESACWDCPLLTSVILPNTVTTIEDHGLGCEDYNKRVVTIPSSVINIGYGAFDVVSARVYAGSYAHTYCIENDVAFELIDSDEAEVPIADFTYTSDGKSITITDYIGTDTDVVIPLTIEGLPVTSIGTSAFFNCPNLTSIFIPDSVTSIGSDAFYRCTNLTSIIIPNGVTEINQLTFSNCTNLSNVILPDNLTSIGGSAFASCSKLTSMAIPDNVTSIGVGAFMDCTSLTSMIIPEGVTSIGIYTFENCASLTSIIIPDSVTTIDRDAFLGCKMLTVYASAGSYAEQWCIKYSMPYDTI